MEDINSTLKQTNKLLIKFTSLRLAFLRGLLTGFGGILGATLLLALFVWGLSSLEVIPVIGTFVSQVIDFVVQNSSIPDPRLP